MCEPTTIAIAAAAASGAMETASQASAAAETNRAARKTFRSALQSQADQTVGIERRRIEEGRTLVQQGNQVALEQEAATASTALSAASRGVSGLSIDALIAEEYRAGAKNKKSLKDERENIQFSDRQSRLGLRSQTEARIESTPTANFGLADFAINHVKTGLKVASIAAGAP